MKKLFNILLFILVCQLSYANGVVIVDQSEGTYMRMQQSQVDVIVQNQIATIVSSQKFINEFDSAFTINYAFPVPVDASVTQLRWRVDGGEWAIAVFTIGDSGDGGNGGDSHPSLLQYLGETPLFFSSEDIVAAGGDIEVEISYVQLLAYSFDEVTFEYPSDYSLIQTGIIENFQNLDFTLFSERTIEAINLFNNDGDTTNDGNTATVAINANESTSINDILIVYQLASDELGVIPFSTLLPEGTNECDDFGDGFFGLVVEPESNENTEIIDKNFVLIIDKSGSMSGNKIVQAREASAFIVNNLNFGDYFNIVDFSTNASLFSPDLVEYTVDNGNDAVSYINNISASGGTNIAASLVTAINQFDFVSPDKANIIVFFTDGEATSGETDTSAILNIVEETVEENETEIFLFTFGIGENVTTDLLTNLAVQNNGFVTFLADDQIEDIISDFYLTIRNPVLLNPVLSVNPSSALSNIYPDPLPNLYKGQQLILAGRYDVAQDISLTLTGTAFNQEVEYNYDVSLSDLNNPSYAFLPKLWAKNKIESLTIEFFSLPEGSPEAMAIQAIIEETSICYQVLSPFTTLSDGELGIEEFLEDQGHGLAFSPNPFINETRAVVKLRADELITVKIYDLSGKLIKTLEIEGQFGDNYIEWNGNDESGRSVDSGVYIYQVTVGKGKMFAGKLVKI